MPAWIKTVAVINPIDYAVEAVRAVMLDGSTGYSQYLKCVAILEFFTAATITWAVAALTPSAIDAARLTCHSQLIQRAA